MHPTIAKMMIDDRQRELVRQAERARQAQRYRPSWLVRLLRRITKEN
jgi:hypothetical protein